MQGEGYLPKPQVMFELQARFKNIVVFYDNDFINPDNPGRALSTRLADLYHLKRIEIPEEYKAKDPSDLYKLWGEKTYKEVLQKLLKNELINY